MSLQVMPPHGTRKRNQYFRVSKFTSPSESHYQHLSGCVCASLTEEQNEQDALGSDTDRNTTAEQQQQQKAREKKSRGHLNIVSSKKIQFQ